MTKKEFIKLCYRNEDKGDTVIGFFTYDGNLVHLDCGNVKTEESYYNFLCGQKCSRAKAAWDFSCVNFSGIIFNLINDFELIFNAKFCQECLKKCPVTKEDIKLELLKIKLRNKI